MKKTLLVIAALLAAAAATAIIKQIKSSRLANDTTEEDNIYFDYLGV
jgi:hypothetical protein